MENTDPTIFELAPVAMWIEDFSGVKQQFELWRSEGVEDIRAYLEEDIERVSSCSEKIKIIRVNRKTLDLFEAETLGRVLLTPEDVTEREDARRNDIASRQYAA